MRPSSLCITVALTPSLCQRAPCAAYSIAIVLIGVLLSACGGEHADPLASTIAAPRIQTQPQSQLVEFGRSATFSVTASGFGPMAYQWYRNGSEIAGATSTTYVIAAASVSDSGASFTVVVTNGGGSTSSSAATLTVAAESASANCDPALHGVVPGAVDTTNFQNMLREVKR